MRGPSGPATPERTHGDMEEDDRGRPSDRGHPASRGRGSELEDPQHEAECLFVQVVRQLPRGEIVRRLSPGERTALAATCLTMMAAVLEGCEGVTWTTYQADVSQELYRKLRRVVENRATARIGWLPLSSPDQSAVWHVVREVGADEQDAGRIVQLRASCEWRKLPVTPDMTKLEHLYLYGCKIAQRWGENWLPASVAPSIKVLGVANTDLTRIPDGLTALRELDISLCAMARALDPLGGTELDEDFLPRSCRGSLRVLNAFATVLRALPEDLTALEHLQISNLGDAAMRLPESSVRKLKTLLIEGRCDSLPAGMEALESLMIRECVFDDTSDEPLPLLPPSSAARVRNIVADHSTLRGLPEGMADLEWLSVSYCPELAPTEWLPVSSAGRLRVLLADSTAIERLPAHMEALEILSVCHCEQLDPDGWLPESSGTRLRFLRATQCSMRRLPDNMEALEYLRVDSCERLAGEGFLPESSATALRGLSAKRSPIRKLPGNMAALEVLHIVKCDQLDEECVLPGSSAGKLRVLHASGSSLRALPQGATAVEELLVRGCEALGGVLDAGAIARLHTWDVRDTKLSVPEGTPSCQGEVYKWRDPRTPLLEGMMGFYL
ncbi:unnamed protein product [Pedinophyceae sp. YPF-701]|nr:unnamed protein product [Pedinophyceae sp. YPF-701]